MEYKGHYFYSEQIVSIISATSIVCPTVFIPAVRNGFDWSERVEFRLMYYRGIKRIRTSHPYSGCANRGIERIHSSAVWQCLINSNLILICWKKQINKIII